MNYWVYNITLKCGKVIEEFHLPFNLSKAMEKYGYFNGAIGHDHDRIFDVKHQKCVLYGEIVAWETITLPMEDEYPNGITGAYTISVTNEHPGIGDIEIQLSSDSHVSGVGLSNDKAEEFANNILKQVEDNRQNAS